jgi:hypothetical protein
MGLDMEDRNTVSEYKKQVKQAILKQSHLLPKTLKESEQTPAATLQSSSNHHTDTKHIH